jgi:hypothetical protein
VNSDPRRPPNSDIIERLRDDETGQPMEVTALVGFIGSGRGGAVRVYPDEEGQRWMDVPLERVVSYASFGEVDARRPGRTVVWVDREWMRDPVFREDALTDFSAFFAEEDSWISTWQLIPASRLVAADMLGLLADLPGGTT